MDPKKVAEAAKGMEAASNAEAAKAAVPTMGQAAGAGGGAGGLVDAAQRSNPPGSSAPELPEIPSANQIATKETEEQLEEVTAEIEPGEPEGSPVEDEVSEKPDLGQGATSQIADSSDVAMMSLGGIAAMAPDQGSNVAGQAMKVAAVGAAGATAAQALTIAAILKYLKLLMAMVQAVVQNAWSIVTAFVANLASSAVSFVVGIGATVGNALGVSVFAGAFTGVVGSAVALGALVIGLFTFVTGSSAAETAIAYQSCVADARKQVAAADPVNIESAQLQNAEMAYSIFSGWGLSDASIAGILGNWQAESGIDPTAVEGYSASYAMTEAKKEDAANISNGIGVAQWTGGRNTNLRDFAAGIDQSWWSMNTQMSYLRSSGEGSDANIFTDSTYTLMTSPGAAALEFHDRWERSADTEAMKQRRAEFADNWFAYMAFWEADLALASSILEQSGDTAGEANATQIAKAKSKCRGLDTNAVFLMDGGMDHESAQALVDLYNLEGDAFLRGRYNGGGPGACNGNYIANCVSFTTYFLNKYTTVQSYPTGNGIDTAANTASLLGKELSTVPSAYSIGSGPGTGSAGHTLVVLAVSGDNVTVAEAGWCAFGGRIQTRSAQTMMDQGWVFVDLSDNMLAADEVMQA